MFVQIKISCLLWQQLIPYSRVFSRAFSRILIALETIERTPKISDHRNSVLSNYPVCLRFLNYAYVFTLFQQRGKLIQIYKFVRRQLSFRILSPKKSSFELGEPRRVNQKREAKSYKYIGTKSRVKAIRISLIKRM